MNIDASTKTSAELLGLARQQGYPISAFQLVRWHRAGLLPRPQQQPLEVARGSRTLYPPGTGEQLLLLCSLRARERRLAHLAWELWLAGYRVNDRIIRGQLRQATRRIAGWMQWFADFKHTIRLQDAEQVLNLLEHYAAGPLPAQPLRRIRKRIGRSHFSTFLMRLMELAGEEESEITSAADPYEQQLDLRILARGLGLEKRFVFKQEALEAYLVQFLLPHLHWFFHWSQEVHWEALLDQVTAFEILQVRDELQTWLMRLGDGKRYWDWLPADYPRWEIDLEEIFQALPPADQALALVVWLALRTCPPSQFKARPAIVIGPDGPSYVYIRGAGSKGMSGDT